MVLETWPEPVLGPHPQTLETLKATTTTTSERVLAQAVGGELVVTAVRGLLSVQQHYPVHVVAASNPVHVVTASNAQVMFEVEGSALGFVPIVISGLGSPSVPAGHGLWLSQGACPSFSQLTQGVAGKNEFWQANFDRKTGLYELVFNVEIFSTTTFAFGSNPATWTCQEGQWPDADCDGTSDCDDGCPSDGAKTTPGACGCGVADTVCGCGVADVDTDGDNVLDCNDGCINDPLKAAPGACGCGVPEQPNCNGGGGGGGKPTVVSTMVCPSSPTAAGVAVPVSFEFMPGNTLDTHTASCNFGTSSYTCSVTESAGSSPGLIACSGTFVVPDLYRISCIVQNQAGAQATVESLGLIPIYDPSAGHVSGGGAFESLVGSYARDEDWAGLCRFAFVCKYKPGKTVPEGKNKIWIHKGTLDFRSSSFEYLLVQGESSMAKMRGQGTLEGDTENLYEFMTTIYDAGGGAPGEDKYHTRIWKENGPGIEDDELVFDNEVGNKNGDWKVDTNIAAGGGIIIHTKSQRRMAAAEVEANATDGEEEPGSRVDVALLGAGLAAVVGGVLVVVGSAMARRRAGALAPKEEEAWADPALKEAAAGGSVGAAPLGSGGARRRSLAMETAGALAVPILAGKGSLESHAGASRHLRVTGHRRESMLEAGGA